MSRELDEFTDQLKAQMELPADREQMWGDFYLELKKVAQNRMRNWRSGSTLSATVLVHEVFLKLGSEEERIFNDKGHFLAVSSMAMRQILVQHIRYKNAEKRKHEPETFDPWHGSNDPTQIDLVLLDESLKELNALDPRMVKIVEARIYGGFSMSEIADALGITTRTVDRVWLKAKMLLSRKLNLEPQG